MPARERSPQVWGQLEKRLGYVRRLVVVVVASLVMERLVEEDVVKTV